MRIAFIAHVFPRLHNTFILNEIVELTKKGHEVFIFSLKNSKETLLNADVVNFRLLEKTYRFLDYQDDNFQPPSTIEEACKSLGRAAQGIDSVANLIKQLNINIIHGIFGNESATAAMVLSYLTDIPFTFETHAYDLFVDFPFAAQKLACSAFVMTESNYNKKYLIEHCGALPERVEVIHLSPNLAMLDRINPTQKLSNLIVSACRLHPIKGLDIALMAIKNLLPKYPDISYIVLGDGESHDSLIKLCQKLKLENNVRFLRDVSNETVADVVSQSAVFLLPCRVHTNGDRDGTPTAIAEASYLRIPVVSTRVSALPELVDNYHTGFLTEPENAQEISSALELLLANPQLAQHMGNNGRQKIASEFNITSSMDKLLANWEKAVC